MAGSLVSMVVVGQKDVLGFGDLSRDVDEYKEKCKALKLENFVVDKG